MWFSYVCDSFDALKLVIPGSSEEKLQSFCRKSVVAAHRKWAQDGKVRFVEYRACGVTFLTSMSTQLPLDEYMQRHLEELTVSLTNQFTQYKRNKTAAASSSTSSAPLQGFTLRTGLSKEEEGGNDVNSTFVRRVHALVNGVLAQAVEALFANPRTVQVTEAEFNSHAAYLNDLRKIPRIGSASEGQARELARCLLRLVLGEWLASDKPLLIHLRQCFRLLDGQVSAAFGQVVGNEVSTLATRALQSASRSVVDSSRLKERKEVLTMIEDTLQSASAPSHFFEVAWRCAQVSRATRRIEEDYWQLQQRMRATYLAGVERYVYRQPTGSAPPAPPPVLLQLLWLLKESPARLFESSPSGPAPPRRCVEELKRLLAESIPLMQVEGGHGHGHEQGHEHDSERGLEVPPVTATAVDAPLPALMSLARTVAAGQMDSSLSHLAIKAVEAATARSRLVLMDRESRPTEQDDVRGDGRVEKRMRVQ
jgi:hypothetical protein